MIQIQWTAANLEEARKVARLLIEQRLVACANIIPGVESIYHWKGKIEVGQEVEVLLKTQEMHFEAIKTAIETHDPMRYPRS